MVFRTLKSSMQRIFHLEHTSLVIAIKKLKPWKRWTKKLRPSPYSILSIFIDQRTHLTFFLLQHHHFIFFSFPCPSWNSCDQDILRVPKFVDRQIVVYACIILLRDIICTCQLTAISHSSEYWLFRLNFLNCKLVSRSRGSNVNNCFIQTNR